MWLLILLVALAISLLWLWLTAQPGCIPLISPLLRALEFKQNTLAFLQKMAHQPLAELNLAGLRLTVLFDAEMTRDFYRSRHLDSYSALSRLGFADSLGELNLMRGATWHARVLRGGSVIEEFESVLERAIEKQLKSKEGSVDLYRMCREITVSAMVEYFVGPKAATESFCKRYLNFQKTHEHAISVAMGLGRWLAWPLLYRARRQRLALVQDLLAAGAITSPYSARLAQISGQPDAQLGDLLIGLLTAATKNVAIAAASTLVNIVESNETDFNSSVLETLRLSALSLGALREVTTDDCPWGPRGTLVSVSHVAMARDAAVFKRPDNFEPCRFAPGALDDPRLPVFGAGTHACPGRKLALHCIRQIVTRLRPRLQSLGICDVLHFDRPSLADRDFAHVQMEEA